MKLLWSIFVWAAGFYSVIEKERSPWIFVIIFFIWIFGAIVIDSNLKVEMEIKKNGKS